MKVCVLGAGIIGATTAYRLLEEFSDGALEVDVIAEAYSPNTTTDVSAGFWLPFIPGGTSDSDLDRWGQPTFDFLCQLWNNPDSLGAELSDLVRAVSLCPVNSFWDRELARAPTEPTLWQRTVFGYKELTNAEANKFKGLPTSNLLGESYTTFTFDPTVSLAIFYPLIQAKGGRLVRRRVNSVEELRHYDCVFNCSGNGATALFNDHTIEPVSGHVVRVSAPWMNTATFLKFKGLGPCYVIPCGKYVVLGAVNTANNWSLRPLHPDDGETVVARCRRMIPSLRHATVVAESIGLRPVRRDGVRLEFEETKTGLKVIHNYGHGGSGVTLFWGCAQDSVSIFKDLLRREGKKIVSAKL